MRRLFILAIAVSAAAVAAVMLAGPSSGTPSLKAAKGGPVTIESWLFADTGTTGTGLSATVKACFKLSGAFDDQGGTPTWSDGNYTSPTDPAGKCGD